MSKDTFCLNEEFFITVVFKNKTDSFILFYPKALLSIIHPSGGFEFDSYFLNDTLYLNQLQKLGPNGCVPFYAF